MNKSQPHPPTGKADRLDFTVSAAVSGQVRREFLSTLAKTHKVPESTIVEQLGEHDYPDEFRETFGPLGLKPDNLADAMTAYWITMWSLVHRRPLPEGELIPAARKQLESLCGNAPQAKREPGRQAMAEAMIYETMFALNKARQFAAISDAESLQAMSETIAANVRRTRAINFKALKLTPAGFVSTKN